MFINQKSYNYDLLNKQPIWDGQLFSQYEIHTGMGGGGKTHFNLSDNGLIGKVFAAPSWKLTQSKKVDYVGVDVFCAWKTLTTKKIDKIQKL